MAKKKAKSGCDCVAQVDKQLKQYNTRLSQELVMNFKTGKARMALPIKTEKINSKSRTPAKMVFAAYCPICGSPISREMDIDGDAD